jgi:hypothetical protein
MSSLNWSNFATEPFDKQKAFLEDAINPDVQYVSAFTGIQGGKSLCASDALFACLYGPKPVTLPEQMRGKTPMEVWLASKSYALANVLLETMKWRTPSEIWASDKQVKRWGLKKNDAYTHWLTPRTHAGDPCPIKIRVRSASDPESFRATPFLAIVNADELAWWKEKSWLNLQGRGVVARTKYIITTSPHGKNFAYRMVALPAGYGTGKLGDPKFRVHAWTSADNPYADKTHIERLRKLFGREYAKQELDGLFTDAIGYVYGEFDRVIHMVAPPSKDPDDYAVVVGGIDPGAADAYVASVWGKTEKGDLGIWHQLEEQVWHHGQTSMRAAPELLKIQKRWNVSKWYCDKRRPTDWITLRDLGVRVEPNIDIHAENDRRTIAPMVAICKEMLRQGRLFIGLDHEFTAEEFERYHYPDETEEREKNTNDNPVDFNNHAMDAMRYAICSVEEVPKSGPRYRKGPSGTPVEIPVGGMAKKIPSMAECLAAQDEKFETSEDRNQGQGRNTLPAWLKARARHRERMV